MLRAQQNDLETTAITKLDTSNFSFDNQEKSIYFQSKNSIILVSFCQRMLSRNNRNNLRSNYKGKLLGHPAMIQKRQFLFLVVPMIGAGLAIVVGGAVVIYGMEKYHQYQIQKGAVVKGQQSPEQKNDVDDKTKPPI